MDRIEINYIAGSDIGRTRYELRRLNYLNSLRWNEELEFLNVTVNGVEVEYNLNAGNSIVSLLRQPAIGDKVNLKIENIPELS